VDGAAASGRCGFDPAETAELATGIDEVPFEIKIKMKLPLR
jgi:hypothetical protein